MDVSMKKYVTDCTKKRSWKNCFLQMIDKGVSTLVVNALKEKIKVIIDTNLEAEFDDLLHEVDTENFKETVNGKVTLYVEYDCDIAYIKPDIDAVLKRASEIRKIYKTVGYPYQAIEILKRKEVIS